MQATLASFIQAMPKVELHVHLEGAIRPETLLDLARRNDVTLPADTVEGLRRWYRFTSFDHFIQVYLAISMCLRTPDDLELVTREFLAGQAAQNVRYTEATYTAYTHFFHKGISFRDQLDAINRARTWAAEALDTKLGLIIDISRDMDPAQARLVADWAIEGQSDGVAALGLGGPEAGFPPELFEAAFARARVAGLPSVPHAGETAGPASIWGALRTLRADRIEHGVRCLEDPDLVAELRYHQVPLDVCPTSNVCLGVVPTMAEHPLPRLLAEELYVTINSDDPPMFDTTLTGEYLAIAETFDLDRATIERLVMNGVGATLLPRAEREVLQARFTAELATLRTRFPA